MATSLRIVLDQQMTEAALQEAVRQMALTFGWLYYHTHDSRRSPSGFTDCVMVRPPRLIVAELKTEKGQLTEAQRAWGNAFFMCPQVEYVVWRPHHWSSGEIESTLRPPASCSSNGGGATNNGG